MKTLILVLICLSFKSFSQPPKIYFIAKDSLNKEQNYIIGRVLIKATNNFFYPANPEILIDSSKSDFGFTQIEKYNLDKGVFESFLPRISYDKVNWTDEINSLKEASYLNLSFGLINMSAFTTGLYRAKVRIRFSKYNRSIKDVTSDWSYFYIEIN